VATGNFAAPPAGFTTQSPYVPAGSYGSGFGYNAATGVGTDAAATTLVISPITTACFACHDDALATAHMTTNGGQIYAARGAPGSGSGALGALASGNGEACLVCHGPGKIADIDAVHPKP
jgi:Outer membrane cytochrome MtrC/MtrF-like, domains II/IV